MRERQNYNQREIDDDEERQKTLMIGLERELPAGFNGCLMEREPTINGSLREGNKSGVRARERRR